MSQTLLFALRIGFFVVLALHANPARADWVEAAELLAPDAALSDWLGNSVSISGDTALVGAFGDDVVGSESGSAYVFVRAGTTWVPEAKLIPGDAGSGDRFGYSVALSGDVAVIGAYREDDLGTDSGAAYVFRRSGTTWTQEAKLKAADAAVGDNFGWRVAVDGDTAVIGSALDDAPGFNSGSAYVFARVGGAWSQQAKPLPGSLPSALGYGWAVAVEGDTVVIGAYSETNGGFSGSGGAYVWTRTGTTWSLEDTLAAGDPSTFAYFGVSVALSGDTALIGAFNDAGLGAAYAFTRSGGVWTEQEKLVPAGLLPGDQFGVDVALDGDTALIGADFDDTSGSSSGAAYVYSRSGAVWTEDAKLTGQSSTASDWFGHSVSLSGDVGLVGATNADTAALAGGSAYVFEPAAWSSYCTAGISASGCQAQLSATGTASATATSGFSVLASTVEGAKDGLYFFGANGRQANPWGNGTSFQCVVPPVARGGLLAASGTSGLCDGAFFQDLNALWCPRCPRPLKNPGAGAVVQAQLWYRDPQNTSNQTTSLSDAIEFPVGP